MVIQNVLGKAVTDKLQEDLEKLEEHTKRIKSKIESGKAIDKSIIDREAKKELNHREAHEKAKVVKRIEHTLRSQHYVEESLDKYSTIIIDISYSFLQLNLLLARASEKAHIYLICDKFAFLQDIYRLFKLLDNYKIMQLAHTFKYSSKSFVPQIGYKEHLEYIVYVNIGDKPVNHLLPNVIESTYAKDSRNLGFYTNLLLRSANAGDTILGINVTNGNLIKAAQAMLCSTVIIPADNIASKDCEKTIKELQFK